jgi:hypothetical protein
MPLRNGSRQIATPPVERTQYTTSSEPDDEEDSTPDPRQASGNYHGSEQSPEVTREPSGGRTLPEILEELNAFSKLHLKLCRQGYHDENLRQQSECITRLEELQREFESTFFSPTPDVDLAPLPPVEDPESSGINSNQHCCDRSTQGSVSTPPSDNAPITSIQGEDPKDPRDKNIPITRLGRVSCTVKPSSTPIAANVTAITKAIPIGVSPNTTTRLLYEDLQDSKANLGPDNFWYRPPKIDHEPAKTACETVESQGINTKLETKAIADGLLTREYAFMHARRPGVLALQGIG